MTRIYPPPTDSTPPIERRSSSPAFLAGMGLLCVAAIAAIVTAVLLAFGGSHATSTPAPAPTPSSTSSTSSGPVHPAASIETLPRELGQLNATALADLLAHGNNQMGG